MLLLRHAKLPYYSRQTCQRASCNAKPSLTSGSLLGTRDSSNSSSSGSLKAFSGGVGRAPYDYPAVVLFDPVTKALEQVGSLKGTAKFRCCTLLADGKVVMAPSSYPAVVLFDPVTKALEEVGSLKGDRKFRCCTLLADASLLLVPSSLRPSRHHYYCYYYC